MRIEAFDFDLPEDRIALRPATPRDAARLLSVRTGAGGGALADARVSDLPGLLRAGDMLVFNDTRVIPARLAGVRCGRGGTTPRIEATLHKRLGDGQWQALVRPARKLEAGDRIRFGRAADASPSAGGDGGVPASPHPALEATVVEKGSNGEVTLGFDVAGAALDATIAAVGVMPLPPYIASRRPADAADDADYQTIYAREQGAVAAPTAGLHFTPRLLDALDAAGIARAFVTLHVGAGTFLPVRAERIGEHRMHAERGEVSEQAARQINETRQRGGRVVAVGTTSLRLLETAAGEDGKVAPFRGETDIFIAPGYRFRATDMLMTNFHLPRSTLFMLVAAFSGLDLMQRAYAHAIASGYRFYSYGDACLLEPVRP